MKEKYITQAFILTVTIIAIVLLVVKIAKDEKATSLRNKNKPKYKHVLLIVADDLGWSDLGYASGEAKTPTIDRLAHTGIELNYTYSYSMCTPSRNSILTGVFAERTGLQHFVLPNSNPVPAGLPLSFNILPQYLKQYGYKSHMVGKWHIGSCNLSYTPAKRGFDSFYGFFYGEENYYTHRVSYINNITGLDFWNQTNEYLEPVLDKNGTYSTYAYVDRMLDIIKKHDQSEPLFLYYAAQNPHSDENFNVPYEYEYIYNQVPDEKRRKILGMTTMLDYSIKKILDELEQKGILEDTLIFFTSDNGGEIFDYQRNYPLRGGKSTAFEGGHRVRAFINSNLLRYKSFAYNGLFHSVDWLPTILTAAIGNEADLKSIDGVSQWHNIINNLKSKRESFIYNIDPFGNKHFTDLCDSPTESIRFKKWKLIRGCPGVLTDWYNLTDFTTPNITIRDKGHLLSISSNYSSSICLDKKEPQKSYFLFDITLDPLEQTNLASSRPCKVKELVKQLEEYKKISVEPLVKEPTEKYRDERANPENWGDKWSPGWC